MNLLHLETSPYLLQHKDNPVHWKPWSEAAFNEAKQRNVPVILSIGYSTCHWCHVMEHESFEKIDTAAIMNEYFVCIKVDREERPDIDEIYMKACQLLNGSGGWPLNCFLLPDKRPFYAGTYFPPESRYGRPSWKEVLKNLSIAYQTKNETVTEQAKQLTHLIQKNEMGTPQQDSFSISASPEYDMYQEAYKKLAADFDGKHGGFGGAPKFPQPFRLQYLLTYHMIYNHSLALEHVCHTLDHMAAGGIFDHVHGGIARYTVDRSWHIPHFEKMLYDNAFLVKILARTYKATGIGRYQKLYLKIIDFVQNHLSHPEGGMVAAIDADSEGVEGKYYLWSTEEINQLPAQHSESLLSYFAIQAKGNWEDSNILYFKGIEQMKSYYESDDYATHRLTEALSILKKEAVSRIHPSIDQKRICSWNAYWGSALCEAYRAMPNNQLMEAATALYKSMSGNFIIDDQLIHVPGYPHDATIGFAEDYTAWTNFLLDLYQITFDVNYRDEAALWLERTGKQFSRTSDPLLHTNKTNQTNQIANLQQVYDSATPSPNSEYLESNARMYLLTNNEAYLDTHLAVSQSLTEIMQKYPHGISLGLSVTANFNLLNEIICISGPEAYNYGKELLGKVPNESIIVVITEDAEAKMLNIPPSSEKTLIYRCKNFVCSLPYDRTETFLSDNT